MSTLACSGPPLWRRLRGPRLVVLMYHRVLPADDPEREVEQPGMYVSPETLDMHLTVLQQHFEFVHLDDWVRAAAVGEALPRLACAVTFDDGWRDNYVHALPVLERHLVPATIFLVSSMIGSTESFWPNLLARRLVARPLDASLPGALGKVLAPAQARAMAEGKWTVTALDAAIVLAKSLGEEEIRALLTQDCEDALEAPKRTVLDAAEIRAMAAGGLVRFGSHTRTHFRCRAGVPREVLEREICASAHEIAACVGRPVELFCFPNGDFTPEALEVVRASYLAAVTTERGWHSPSDDAMRIKRIAVHEDVSSRPDAFLARLTGLL